ncbi:MAG: hypothetical protein F6J90_15255 [Moorea sp. SIOASIH]|uniref:hypothetical protein n=1 Tax=Moorena sp. SIOASIH TaxID=2607817 RepID=UPI0013BB15F7|nr:hypothetical protein [Moorena sp. SIOASIH]NEO37612.1 hypothetical protein [Moorena sp. SIOASIH]
MNIIRKLSAISYQLSAISYQLSAISYQLLAKCLGIWPRYAKATLLEVLISCRDNYP